MKASTQKAKKRYMNDEDLGELQESLSEAVAHAKGEPNNCRVTTIALPPQPRRRSKANIVALRHRLNYSQVMFARALNDRAGLGAGLALSQRCSLETPGNRRETPRGLTGFCLIRRW